LPIDAEVSRNLTRKLALIAASPSWRVAFALLNAV
jgi:hypothetical protein